MSGTGTKYRPLVFEDAFGLDDVKEILRSNLKSKNIRAAYLLSGEYSSGKTTLGRIFSRSILCEDPAEDGSPCNQCSSCVSFLEDRNPSYNEIDAATSGTKERIQELLESLTYESLTSKRIILIDECQELSKAGHDTMLLQLEKNNPNVIFIFCTTDVEKVPPALRSRCVEFVLPQPTEDLIVKKLQKICQIENKSYTDEALTTIVRATGRHYRNAEINLGLIFDMGEVTEENAEKVVQQCEKEIAYLLTTLWYDLEKALKAADYIISRMSVKSIYSTMLRILNDTVKHAYGFNFTSSTYSSVLKVIASQFGGSVYSVIDYLLNRNRLTDITVFQSDLLVIHYKFLQGQFDPKVPIISSGAVPSEEKKVEDKSAIKKGLDYINSKPAWEREDLLRELKKKKTAEQENTGIRDRVAEAWGPDNSKASTTKRPVLRETLTKEEFRKQVSLNAKTPST